MRARRRSPACNLLRFDKAFDIKKDYKAKGCYAIHTSNCDACEIIVESNAISSIQSGGKKVGPGIRPSSASF